MLEVGQLYRNYKEVCIVTNQPVKTGGAKTLQLAHWQTCFLWERQGNKFLITKVMRDITQFNSPEGKWNKNCAIQLLNTVIQTSLTNKDQDAFGYNELICTANEGYQILGLCNGSFPRLAKAECNLPVDKEIKRDFHAKTSTKFYEVFTNLLNSLRKQRILDWNRTFRYTTSLDSKEIIIADLEVRVLIDSVIQSVLEEFNYKILYQVKAFGTEVKFYARVNTLLEDFNIFNCWRVYQIGFSNRAIPRFLEYVNSLEELTSARIDINNKSLHEVAKLIADKQATEDGGAYNYLLDTTIPATNFTKFTK